MPPPATNRVDAWTGNQTRRNLADRSRSSCAWPFPEPSHSGQRVLEGTVGSGLDWTDGLVNEINEMSRQLPAKKRAGGKQTPTKIHVRRVGQKGRVVWLAGDPADDIRGRTNDGRPMRPPKGQPWRRFRPWSALSAGILIISWWIASPIPMRGNAWFECLLVLVLVPGCCQPAARGLLDLCSTGGFSSMPCFDTERDPSAL